MVEVWAPVTDYIGLYEVSNLGRVRSVDKVRQYVNKAGKAVNYSVKGRVLINQTDFAGYSTVMLYSSQGRKTFKVHRLVAQAFISNLSGRDVVNHKDGNKSNNSVTNLEWVTQQENCSHACETGLRSAIKVRCVQTGKCFSTVAEAERYFKFGAGCIWHAIKTNRLTHGLHFVKLI